MSKKVQYECESVDLTDDDSRDTIVESEIGSRNIGSNIQNFNQSPLPPLIPIPRISTPKTRQAASSVPTLTKIQSQGEVPKVADSFETNTIFAGNVALTGSPHSSLETSQIPSLAPPGGKVILIKKNNKLYKIVIPHNVMPSSDSGGPVVINIPEVGPLFIKIDSQAKNQTVVKPGPIIEPFSLNFDDIIEKASMGEVVEERLVAKSTCAPTEKVFSAAQKLFPCWRAPAARTRTKNTFNGFSKKELANSKRCHNQLNYFNVKYKRRLEATKHVKQYKASPNKINTNSSNQKMDTYSDFDSLLVTKKVVVLTGNEETDERNSSRKGTRKKRISGKISRGFCEKINLQPVVCISRCESLETRYRHLIKPCFVSMKRLTDLDEMIKRDCFTMKTLKKNQSFSMPSSNSKSASIAESKVTQETLGKRRSLYLSRLINDVRSFNRSMAFIKPVLVMNEYNYSIVNFKTEFCKSNLVYPVGAHRQFPEKILACNDFRNAVANDYVKLVDSDILCRYFKGEVGPMASVV